MYKPEFEKNHKNLSELVSWLTTWQKYNENQKRSNETDQSINTKRRNINESYRHGKYNTQ